MSEEFLEQEPTQAQLEAFRDNCGPYLAAIDVVIEHLWIIMPVNTWRKEFFGILVPEYDSWMASRGRYRMKASEEAKQQILGLLANQITLLRQQEPQEPPSLAPNTADVTGAPQPLR